MHISSINDYFYNKPNYSVKQNNHQLQTSPSFQAKKIKLENLRPILDKSIIPLAAPFAAELGITVATNEKSTQEPVDYVKQIENMTDKEFHARKIKFYKSLPYQYRMNYSYPLTKENIIIAEIICTDTEFLSSHGIVHNIDLIHGILKNTNKENRILAEKLVAVKEFPKDEIPFILKHTDKNTLTLATILCTSKKLVKEDIWNIGYLLFIAQQDNSANYLIQELSDRGIEVDKMAYLMETLNEHRVKIYTDTDNFTEISPEQIYLQVFRNEPNLSHEELENKTILAIKQTILDVYKNDKALQILVSEFLKNTDMKLIINFFRYVESLYKSNCTSNTGEKLTPELRRKKIMHLLNTHNIQMLKDDIAYGLDLVQDSELKNNIKKQLSEINPQDDSMMQVEQCQNVAELIDVYNNMHNNYSTIYSSFGDNYKYIDCFNYFKEHASAFTEKNSSLKRNELESAAINTVLFAQRFDSLVEYCSKNQDELAEKFYNDYLELIETPSEIKEQCKYINEKFSVKVFLPRNVETSEEQSIATNRLNFIKYELEKWDKASKGKFKRPPVVDLMWMKKNYFDLTSAYVQGASAGFCETRTRAIYIFGFENLEWALRHELTHANDTKRLDVFPDGFVVMKKGKAKGKINTKKSKYYDDFVRIGIPENHIAYAYNDPQEFIAVASEGDLSKATPEFKQQLIDFGMPEWRFDIQ